MKKEEAEKSGRLKKAGFLLLTLFFFLLITELLLRIFVQPSDSCAGTLLGIKLPPFNITPPVNYTGPVFLNAAERGQRKKTSGQSQIVEGEPSPDDLFGIFREDEVIGYTFVENTSSSHNWWQTNNVGARARTDTPRAIGKGKRRVIFFGDSFTNCSQVIQENTWPALLEKNDPRLEALNFGVDGYGMGQSLLRYRRVRTQIDYDRVILVFVPACDLERDINTYRRIMEWHSCKLMPRFTVEDGKLTLIEPPYKTLESLLKENRGVMSERFHTHLKTYDSLYIPTKYEKIPVLSDIIIFRLVIGACNIMQEKRIHRTVYQPGSEAMTVSRAIFRNMAREAQEQDRDFHLILLPRQDEVKQFKSSAAFRERWRTLAGSIASDHIPMADLMDKLAATPESEFDRAYDGFHNGDRTNAMIAKYIGALLNGDIQGRGRATFNQP